VEQWYSNMPIITKSYMSACLVTTLAVHLDLVNVLMLYLNFGLVYNNFELWRLVTNFLYFGPFGLGYVFHMVFLVRHSTLLEENSFRGRTADFFLFVSLWSNQPPDVGLGNMAFCSFLPCAHVFGPKPRNGGCICLGQAQPARSYELLGVVLFQRTLLALGNTRNRVTSWSELVNVRLDGDSSWSCVLLLGRRISSWNRTAIVENSRDVETHF